jgi:RHS repeat-associated protein
MLPAAGSAQLYVEDFLGTSRIVAQNNGVVCYDGDFTPFGGELPWTNTCPAQNNYKFEGKERDTVTSNDDFGARSYSWRFGRWLSADWSAVPVPVPYANLTNPQTLNLYSMVADDPESFADLDGHLNPQANAPGCATPNSCGAASPGSIPSNQAQGAAVVQAAQNHSCGFFCKLGNLLTGNGWGPGPTPPSPPPPPGPPPPLPNFKGDSQGTTPNLDKPLRCINQCYKSLTGKDTTVTSTYEPTKVHAPGSPHREGDAADFHYPDHPDTFLGCAGGCGATYAQDEKKHPSKHSTADHMHVLVSPRPRGASRGDLPPKD